MATASDCGSESWRDIMARDIAEEEQNYEFEFVEDGDKEKLTDKQSNCHKPDHDKLIPLEELSDVKLPKKYRHKKIMDFIRHVCDRTVRIRVKYISMERSHKDKLGRYRGSRALVTGTGFIQQVQRHKAEEQSACPCSTCESLEENNLSWACVTISTAAHVVSSKDELVHTEIDLFYDKEEDAVGREGSRMMTLYGKSVKNLDNILRVDSTSDMCEFSIITHDVEFFGIDTDSKNMVSSYQRGTSSIKDSQLAIIASHPHGLSKCVSLGVLQRKRHKRTTGLFHRDITYEYNAPTCPGSSGASIHVLDEENNLIIDSLSTHSQGLSDGRNISADTKAVSRCGQIIIITTHFMWVMFVSRLMNRFRKIFES